MIDEREKVLFMYSSESVVGFRRVFEGATTYRSKIVRREYRDLVKERKEWGREGLPPRIEESFFTVPCIYIYISLFGVSRCWRHVDLYEAARFMRKNRAIESQHGAGVIASG